MDRHRIELILKQICETSSFTGFELDEGRSYKGGIPKAHYFLAYNSALDGSPQTILLDLLFEDPPYPKIQSTPIEGPFIKQDGSPISVNSPSLETITGDKLTAFAPNTTGVLYDSRKDLEIVKQLFDLGVLYDEVKDFKAVEDTYRLCVVKEIEYRFSGGIDMSDVLNDTIATCELIARRDPQENEPNQAHFDEIQAGLRRFTGYTANERFRIEDAILAASKVAVMAAKIKTDDTTPLPRYSTGMNRSDYIFDSNRYSYLNRKLRNVKGGAWFYWHSALTILGEI